MLVPDAEAMQAWWDADYSWDALALKSVSIDGAVIGLNEVFGSFRDDLVCFDNRLWTPLHIPWFTPKHRFDTAAPNKTLLIKEWLRAPNVNNYCLSGIVTPSGITLPREAQGSFVADQALIGGALALGGISALRVTRSWIGGNLRARRCTFDEDVTIFKTRITSALDLSDCSFAKIVDIRNTTIDGSAELAGGCFNGYALMIQDSHLKSSLNLNKANIAGDIVLDRGEYGGDILCEDAMIAGNLRADEASFSGRFSLVRTTVQGEIGLDCAQIMGELVLDNGIFMHDIQLRGAPGQTLAGFSARDADIRGRIDVSGRTFTQPIDCSRAQFSTPPVFHGATLHPDISFAGSRFNDVPRSLRKNIRNKRNIWLRWFSKMLPFRWTTSADDRASYNLSCEQICSAYRTLRLSAAKISNIEYESRFHVLELRTRRARIDIPIMESVISFAYDFMGAYGTSISRPLTTIALVPVAGTLLITFLFADEITKNDLFTTFRFSLRQMTPPPTAWSSSDLAGFGKPISTIAAAWPAPLFVIGTVMFIITATMLAVLLLAIQRRFRQ